VVDGKGLFIGLPEDPNEPYIVYLAESWKGLRIFESDPAIPGLLRYNGIFSQTRGYAMAVAVRDGYAYVADDELGLTVVDARELTLGLVQVVSGTDTPGRALDVTLDGDYAFVADGPEGLGVFQVNGPDEPILFARLELAGHCRAIAVRDGYAFLAATTGGLHIVDVSNPAGPAHVGTVPGSNAVGVALLSDGHILVCDREDGLLVLSGSTPR
jgi:hypothetical protein